MIYRYKLNEHPDNAGIESRVIQGVTFYKDHWVTIPQGETRIQPFLRLLRVEEASNPEPKEDEESNAEPIEVVEVDSNEEAQHFDFGSYSKAELVDYLLPSYDGSKRNLQRAKHEELVKMAKELSENA